MRTIYRRQLLTAQFVVALNISLCVAFERVFTFWSNMMHTECSLILGFAYSTNYSLYLNFTQACVLKVEASNITKVPFVRAVPCRVYSVRLEISCLSYCAVFK